MSHQLGAEDNTAHLIKYKPQQRYISAESQDQVIACQEAIQATTTPKSINTITSPGDNRWWPPWRIKLKKFAKYAN